MVNQSYELYNPYEGMKASEVQSRWDNSNPYTKEGLDERFKCLTAAVRNCCLKQNGYRPLDNEYIADAVLRAWEAYYLRYLDKEIKLSSFVYLYCYGVVHGKYKCNQDITIPLSQIESDEIEGDDLLDLISDD